MGPLLATGTLFATWFGAETCLGGAGAAYADGVSLATAEPFAYGLCIVFLGLVFATRLWNLRLTTLADFFRVRFAPSVERVAAVLMIPTSLLWAARCRLMVTAGDRERALAELQNVLRHASLPEAELDALTLAATTRTLVPEDFDRLAALPAELLATPAGEFARALLALRRGDPTTALEHFAGAEARADGAQLYFAALASLQSDAENASERAHELLEQLVRDYPSSSAARHAGSFARQLAPRPATADDNESNR
jgi:hypothetical protein